MPGGETQSLEVKHSLTNVATADIISGYRVPLILCPLGQNEQLEVLSVEGVFETLPTAGDVALFTTDNDGDDVAVPGVVETEIEGVWVAKEPITLFRGSLILKEDDTFPRKLYALLTDITLGPGLGLAFQTTYRVVRHD